MLKHSVSCVELGCHIGEGGGRKSDVRRDFGLSSREKRFIKGMLCIYFLFNMYTVTVHPYFCRKQHFTYLLKLRLIN